MNQITEIQKIFAAFLFTVIANTEVTANCFITTTDDRLETKDLDSTENDESISESMKFKIYYRTMINKTKVTYFEAAVNFPFLKPSFKMAVKFYSFFANSAMGKS